MNSCVTIKGNFNCDEGVSVVCVREWRVQTPGPWQWWPPTPEPEPRQIPSVSSKASWSWHLVTTRHPTPGARGTTALWSPGARWWGPGPPRGRGRGATRRGQSLSGPGRSALHTHNSIHSQRIIIYSSITQKLSETLTLNQFLGEKRYSLSNIHFMLPPAHGYLAPF